MSGAKLMTKPTSEQYDRIVSEAAAARAVQGIAVRMVNAGISETQAKAIADAARGYLVYGLGYEREARGILTKAGFMNGQTDVLISEIARIASSAAID